MRRQYSSNPELILSVPDLLRHAINVPPSREVPFELGQVDSEASDRGWMPEEEGWPKELRKAVFATDALLECFSCFFHDKNECDAHPDRHADRQYLRAWLNTLNVGDGVITFNWDSTVERTLAENGRWTPLTGYGFEKSLRVRSADSRFEDGPLPPDLSAFSEVTVLKLHGSFGWVKLADSFYFDPLFLDSFEFFYRGSA